MGMRREDILAEAAPEVLASKMTTLGFVEQATYFLEVLKKNLMSSPQGLDIPAIRLLFQSIQQTISEAEHGLDRYQEIRNMARKITKIKLDAKPANDDGRPDGGEEIYDFVPNRPTNMGPQTKEVIHDDTEEEEEEEEKELTPPPSRPPTDKKLN